MTECCIINNEVTTGYDFWIDYGSITLINCSVDNFEKNENGDLTTDECGSFSFINALYLFSNGSCATSLDYISGMIMTGVIVIKTEKMIYETHYIHLLLICICAFFMTFLYC